MPGLLDQSQMNEEQRRLLEMIMNNRGLLAQQPIEQPQGAMYGYDNAVQNNPLLLDYQRELMQMLFGQRK